MQPQQSQRPQKKHPNTSANKDTAPSGSHREELQRAWQNLGLQEGCALLSTTRPVSESSRQMIPALHGVTCHKRHVTTPLQGQHSPAFRCPWVLAALARQETAQTQAGPSHQCSTPRGFVDAFPALEALPHCPACASVAPQGAVQGVCQHGDLPGPGSESSQLTALSSSWARSGRC